MSTIFNVDKDINDCLEIINSRKASTRGSGKIYRNTNEYLSSILNPSLIAGKEVLSVLASSDQPFSCYYNGAKSVDTFDSNMLAYYYFFLKKWCMMYTGAYYLSANNEDLRRCIELHSNTPEELIAYKFWKEVLVNIKESLYYSELFYKGTAWWNVPYMEDMNTFLRKVVGLKPNFTNGNIFEPLTINKQYDVVVLSNILEYLYDDIEYDTKSANVALDNLLKLLKPEGIVISSNIIDYEYSGNEIFEEFFEYQEGPSGLNRLYNKQVPMYYTYKKK